MHTPPTTWQNLNCMFDIDVLTGSHHQQCCRIAVSSQSGVIHYLNITSYMFTITIYTVLRYFGVSFDLFCDISVVLFCDL